MIDAVEVHLLRDIGCEFVFELTEDSLLSVQVAPARTAGTILEERFEVADGSGAVLPAPVEVAAELGGRIHLVSASPGTMTFRYAATIRGHAASPATPTLDAKLESIVALRQSRYCPSDALVGFATTEFADSSEDSPYDTALRVASWVFEHLAYSAGSSGPLDTAVETLLSGAGVCRDFAHLTIAFCRALGVPARLASVYAPGLSPMDFHAVVEVLSPTGWRVLDPTRLAPRATFVRIATGRDAADTAFATTQQGRAELVAFRVFASSGGDLPDDDHTHAVSLG